MQQQQQPPSYEQATYYVAQPHILQPQPVVIVQHQTATPVGPQATFVRCPNCHVRKVTRVQYEPNMRTHLMAALLCVLGLWCCVCLPYCMGSCMNANHYCSNCNKFIGTYSGN